MKRTVIAVLTAIAMTAAVIAQPNVYVWTNSGAASEVVNIPTDLTNAVQVSGGSTHAVALCSDGRVVAWGKNDAGQTNIPTDFSAPVSQVCAGSNFTAALLSDGTVRDWGQIYMDNSYNQTRLAGITNATMISATATNIYVVMSDGTVTTFPFEFWKGPASSMSGISNAVYIAASGGSSWIVLGNDGSLWNGTLGSKVSSNAFSAFALSVQAGQSAVARSSDQKVNWWNQAVGGAGTTPSDQTNIVALSVGCPNCILSLDSAGNVKRVTGTGLTVPTNLPPFSAISAGNKFGLGILK